VASSNSFQTVLANLSGNLEVELLDCVPFLNQIDIFSLARKLIVKHFPHLHASLDVQDELGDFFLFHDWSQYMRLVPHKSSSATPHAIESANRS
jgi:hypothetical protein